MSEVKRLPMWRWPTAPLWKRIVLRCAERRGEYDSNRELDEGILPYIYWGSNSFYTWAKDPDKVFPPKEATGKVYDPFKGGKVVIDAEGNLYVPLPKRVRLLRRGKRVLGELS